MAHASTKKKLLPRDAVSKVAQQRLSVLELAREPGTVAEACATQATARTRNGRWTPFMPARSKVGRPRTTDLRAIWDAIRHLVRHVVRTRKSQAEA